MATIPLDTLSHSKTPTQANIGDLFALSIDATAASNPITVYDPGGATGAPPFAFTIIFIFVEARATNAGGTVTVERDAGDAGVWVAVNPTAIAMATDQAVVGVADINDAQSSVATADGLRVNKNAAGDQGIVRLMCVRTG